MTSRASEMKARAKKALFCLSSSTLSNILTLQMKETQLDWKKENAISPSLPYYISI